jgi:hypothetical protein
LGSSARPKLYFIFNRCHRGFRLKLRMRDVVENLEHDELVKVIKDIEETGGLHLKNLVKEQIKENEKLHDNCCAICSNKLDPSSTNNYTLIFEPDDFRKKASFCALDCLEYFLGNLKKIKNGEDPWKIQKQSS